VLALRDGILSLIVRGRRKQSLSLPLKLNDGQWHRVMLNSVDRKVTLGIEFGNSKQYSSAQIRLPKKLNASNMMFIGGIAENSLTLPQELVAKLEGFKGCIRKLIINNSTQDLAKPGRHHNVGQCFPRVEKGAYFPGDAFAVYSKLSTERVVLLIN
jgi:laminin, alpha 1/2